MVHAPGVPQAGARIDGFLTESGEGGGEGELGEGAAVEGLDADDADRVREADGGEGGTALERAVADRGHGGGESDGGEGGALEGAAANLGERGVGRDR